MMALRSVKVAGGDRLLCYCERRAEACRGRLQAGMAGQEV